MLFSLYNKDLSISTKRKQCEQITLLILKKSEMLQSNLKSEIIDVIKIQNSQIHTSRNNNNESIKKKYYYLSKCIVYMHDDMYSNRFLLYILIHLDQFSILWIWHLCNGQFAIQQKASKTYCLVLHITKKKKNIYVKLKYF